MVEVFVLSLVINGKEKRRNEFSRTELKLLLEGLLYAKVKDYCGKRKTAYGKIYKKISEVKR